MRKILGSLLIIALVASVAAIGVSGAWFTDLKVDDEKQYITTTTANVEVGDTTGFPLYFEELAPSVWTDWEQVTVQNDSTIKMDLYMGLQSQDENENGLDLKGLLDVQIQRWDSPNWVWVYNADVTGLFAEWQKIADDMAVDETKTYRVRVHLSTDAGEDEQDGSTGPTLVLLYGVQWNGPAPDGSPWDYDLG